MLVTTPPKNLFNGVLFPSDKQTHTRPSYSAPVKRKAISTEFSNELPTRLYNNKLASTEMAMAESGINRLKNKVTTFRPHWQSQATELANKKIIAKHYRKELMKGDNEKHDVTNLMRLPTANLIKELTKRAKQLNQ